MSNPIANEYQVVKFTRVSPFTGKENTMEFPVTEQQMALYASGAFIQDAFPHLSDDAREFIKSGIPSEEWAEYLGTEPEE